MSISIGRRYGFKSALAISWFLSIIPSMVNAQFDSLNWINQYSNHSVSSRDKLFDVRLAGKEHLVLTGSTENDYTNFDISTITLENNLTLRWKESYSDTADYLSNDQLRDMTVDSSGSVLIATSSNALLKRSHGGTLAWSKNYGTIGGTSFMVNFADIETDTAGNCYLLFGCMVEYSSTGENDTKTVLVKYDKEGNMLWYRKSDICYPRKLLIDEKQDALAINQGDENWGRVTVVKKYRKNGDLFYDKRYPETSIEIVDAKLDNESNLWLFSNYSLTDLANPTSSDVLISKFDSLGNELGRLVYDSEYQLMESVKQVQSFRDSEYLIAIESNSPGTGIDNQFIAIDAELHLTGSWRYDSEHHDNDYLVSFDRTGYGDIVVTGISFSDSRNFTPFVYKLKGLNEVEWTAVPSISSDFAVYPKRILVDRYGTIILAGDAAMTVNEELGLYTHTNIFLSRFTPSGEELNTAEFGNQGKSDIVGSVAQPDRLGNVYVSGIEQYGPDFLALASFYDEDIFIHKYDSEGDIEWRRKIDLQQRHVSYVNHFLTGDTLITVAGEYGSNTPTGYEHKTVLYSLNTDGTRRDSTGFDGTLRFAVQNKSGNIFLVVNNLTIYKYSVTLGRIKDITIPTSDDHISKIIVTDNSLFILTSHGYNLFRYDFDLNPKWNISLSSHMGVVTSIDADDDDNVFVTGYTNGNGQVLIINTDGSVARTIQIGPFEHALVKPLMNGDLVAAGQYTDGIGNPATGAVLYSQEGILKKQVTVTSIVTRILESKDGFIYFIDEHNRYMKFSAELTQITDDNYFGDDNYRGVDGYGYMFYINDAVLSPDKGLILTGSLGVSWYADGAQFSWNVLTVAKVGRLNRSPSIMSDLLPDAVAGVAYSYQLTAVDPDNDVVRFRLSAGPLWLLIGNNGLLSGTPSASDVGLTQVVVVGYDEYLGEATRTYQLTVAPGGSTVSDNHYDEGLVVYPNPSDDFINVEITAPVNRKLRAYLIDPTGRIIRDLTPLVMGETEFRIDCQGLSPGSYYLLIRSGNKSYTKKIILN